MTDAISATVEPSKYYVQIESILNYSEPIPNPILKPIPKLQRKSTEFPELLSGCSFTFHYRFTTLTYEKPLLEGLPRT